MRPSRDGPRGLGLLLLALAVLAAGTLAGCLSGGGGGGSTGAGSGAASGCPQRAASGTPTNASGTLSGDATWSFDPDRPVDVRVTDVVRLSSGTLTVEPCTVVVFEEGAGLQIYAEAGLVAAGEDGKPVTFTGAKDTPGHWQGLRLASDDTGEVRIEHAVVEHAGHGGYGALHLEALHPGNPVEIRQTTVRHNSHYGLVDERQEADSDDPAEDYLVLGENAWEDNTPGHTSLPVALAAALDADSSFDASTELGNRVHASTMYDDFSGTHTWDVADVPYTFDIHNKWLRTTASWTLGPGVTLEFGPDNNVEPGGIYLKGSSELHAKGTQDAPVVFTGQTDEPRTWRGLYLMLNDTTNHRFEHVVIEDAGMGDTWPEPALNIHRFDNDVGLTLSHVTARNNEIDGIRINPADGYEATEPVPGFTVDHLTVTGNGGPGLSTTTGIVQHLDAETSTYQGNDGYGIQAPPGGQLYHPTIEGEQTWPAFDAPVELGVGDGVPPLQLHGRWTLEPGLTLALAPEFGIDVVGEGDHSNPGLTAEGTEGEPIRFTAANDSRPWEELNFHGPNTTSTLDNVIVEGGGGDYHAPGDYRSRWQLVIDRRGQGSDFHVTVRDTTVQDSDKHGLYIGHNNMRDQITLDGNTYRGNNGYPITVRSINVDVLDPLAEFEEGGGETPQKVLVVQRDFSNTEGELRIEPPAMDVPYLLYHGWWTKDDTIVLEAGTTIEVADDRRIQIGNQHLASSGTESTATLEAHGTAAEPIRIEGQEKEPGAWRGIWFDTLSKDNRLDHVHVRHGGSTNHISAYWGAPCWYGCQDSPAAQGNVFIHGDPDLEKYPRVDWRSGSSRDGDGQGIFFDMSCAAFAPGPQLSWDAVDWPEELGDCGLSSSRG